MSADAGALLARSAARGRADSSGASSPRGNIAVNGRRYENGVASPTVRTLARLLRAAGHELKLSGPAASPHAPNGPVAARLREHRAEIQAAAAAAGAVNVRVFGSVARGEETPESDIDLLVDFPAGEHGLFPLLRLAAEIERLVGRPVDVAAVEVMAEPVRARALAEAIPL